jgi:isochorismate synthase
VTGGLAAHLAAVRCEARALGRPLLAAWCERARSARNPLAHFAASTDDERWFWSVPARGLSIAARGRVAAIETHGPGRFVEAAAAARARFAELRTAADSATRATAAEIGPLWVGGFAFGDQPLQDSVWAGTPALRFVLPERSVVQHGARRFRVLAARVGPDTDLDALEARLRGDSETAATTPGRPGVPGFAALADRSPETYRRCIDTALGAIARGDLEKVVLARSCRVARRGAFDAAQVLATLCAQHPDCFVFGVGAGDTCFVGATPERLLRRTGRSVEASAIAGSAPRGRTPQEDRQLARTLRESKKEQAEHEVVRRTIAAALAPVCEQLDAPESPGLLTLDGIQHLHTRIAGRLRSGPDTDVLELAGRLHPTPAVGGAPREAARAFLAEHEGLERGWYAGGVGWLSPCGDGELAVALRCARLHGRHATLYAGAGIVEGSDPEAELAETRLKLRAALAALVEL